MDNKIVDVEAKVSLDDYSGVSHLGMAVHQLRDEAAVLAPRLKGRRVWMVNSTDKGGGVAEMLPRVITLLRELGIDAHWAVMQTEEMPFFELTKRLHNNIHGSGRGEFTGDDIELYDKVNRASADHLKTLLRSQDILVVHDPQPCGMGRLLKEEVGLPTLWRCHIGLDQRTATTSAAWRFLRPYASEYHQAVFSAPEYIPDFLAGRSTIIYPAIDPLSQKNRDLSPHKLQGILCNAGIASEQHPVVTPPFEEQAQRLQPDGSFAPATSPSEIGLLYRPVVLQVSRWDRLKGWRPLLEAFCEVKNQLRRGELSDARHARRIEILRLVLAGPDPASIQDDPEGMEVLNELRELYVKLPPELQLDVVLLALPMGSRKLNALMVNALQRAASLVVQNSLQEGFGLTATEAMWKRKALLTSQACGLRQQVHDGVHGRSLPDPTDVSALAMVMNEMLLDPIQRELWGQAGQRHVHQQFLVFNQVTKWLHTLTHTVTEFEH